MLDQPGMGIKLYFLYYIRPKEVLTLAVQARIAALTPALFNTPYFNVLSSKNSIRGQHHFLSFFMISLINDNIYNHSFALQVPKFVR